MVDVRFAHVRNVGENTAQISSGCGS